MIALTGDTDQLLHEAVEQAGGKILSRGKWEGGEPYLFFKDPDGYEVEIWFE